MCGIIGYVGRKRECVPFLIDSLKRLEYRGYDSAGISAITPKGRIKTLKCQGVVSELAELVSSWREQTQIGIGHTRWATHGEPSDLNAHPHLDCTGRVALVHNGVIENYQALKKRLLARGHKLCSETDSEVLVHLIESQLAELEEQDVVETVRLALKEVRGTYGLAMISIDQPDQIIVARQGSPIVVGVGDGEAFVASDVSAIVSVCSEVIFLDDGEVALLSAQGVDIRTLHNDRICKKKQKIDWTPEQAHRQGYDHFMAKEIHEQPQVLQDSIRGRLKVDDRAVLLGLRDVTRRLSQIDRLIIAGCGSAYFAGQVGEYVIEEIAEVPVEVELASEFRYRRPIIDPQTAVLAISQSGETADTLEAVRLAKKRQALTLGIVNTIGSSIARETEAGVYNHAGPEIGVASTKAFISQLAVLFLYALVLADLRQVPTSTERHRLAREMHELPRKIKQVLNLSDSIRTIAHRFTNVHDFYFMGRKYSYPVACEGALKLKEIAYVHAEGYAAGEMKHGPIALVEPNFVSVFVMPRDSVYEKTRSNLEEIRARGGQIICITDEGDDELRELADEVIEVPRTLEPLSPFLTVIPLQLFAYHMAVAKGYDPDKPRNLAKSVTVE